MMKLIVPNGKERLVTLEAMIAGAVPRKAFEISSIKRDGSVVVRFKSTEDTDAGTLTQQAADMLHDLTGFDYEWSSDECRLSVNLLDVPVK